MLCYVVLCYVMPCYAMLCYAMLRDVMLCYVMLRYVMLCYVIGVQTQLLTSTNTEQVKWEQVGYVTV